MRLLIYITLLLSSSLYGQVDFSDAIHTVTNGNWSNPAIWSGGVVPRANDRVVIKGNHNIYLDLVGASSGARVELCSDIKIERKGKLEIGHNQDNFAKDIQINGSLICNGVLALGRNQPENSGDGLKYKYNSRLFFNFKDQQSYISGTGFLHAKSISLASQIDDVQVVVDHYNILCDENFVAKSDKKLSVDFKHFSFLKAKGTLGLTGSTYQWSSENASAIFNISGLVIAGDISLFTKNSNLYEASEIYVKDGGVLSLGNINKTNLYQSAEAGFNIVLETGSLLKMGENCPDLLDVVAYDSNLNLNNDGELRYHYSKTLSSSTEIIDQVNANRPDLVGADSRLLDIMGSSHIAGWYHFTDRPFLLEGLDYYRDFGYNSIKTTLSAQNGKMYSAYPFNHQWPKFSRLVNIAQHEMLDSLFSRDHIKTHTFWANSKNSGFYKSGPDFNLETYLDEEQQYYELTKYLLEKYGHLDKKFVYQNWEGDWMLRGQGVKWEDDPSLIPDDVDWLIDGMSRMFRARQRGTERARNEFPDSKALVLHGIEFNKLWLEKNGQRLTMMDNNTPSVLENVISQCRIDISSWSAYDGRWFNTENPFPSSMWKGIEIANYFTNSTGVISEGIPVQIGEFAINENPPFSSETKASIEEKYDKLCGLALASGIQNFYLWNLYCSGNQSVTLEKGVEYDPAYLYQYLDGKWLIEPNGEWGYAAEYLMNLFKNELSLEDNNPFNLKIQNPARETLNMSFDDEKLYLEIYDLNGNKIKEGIYYNNQQFDISTINNGVYLLKINDLYKEQTIKILINN